MAIDRFGTDGNDFIQPNGSLNPGYWVIKYFTNDNNGNTILEREELIPDQDSNFYVSPGDDYFSSGIGNDRVIFNIEGVTQPISVRYNALRDKGQVASEFGLTIFDFFESISIKGGPGNDNIETTDGDDYIEGNGGNDSISSYGSSDTIFGGSGDDALNYLSAYLAAPVGSPFFDGGDGIDRIDFRLQSWSADINADLRMARTNLIIENLQTGERVDLKSFERTFFYSGYGNDYVIMNADCLVFDAYHGNDHALFDGSTSSMSIKVQKLFENDYLVSSGSQATRITSIERLDVIGGAANDAISTFGVASLAFGGAGNDTLSGDRGSDTLVGGAGADALFGGSAGFDFASFSDAEAGVTARLDFPSLNTGEAAGDRYTSIEGLIGSQFSDFLLVGDGVANYIAALGGDDYAAGEAGNDTILGGEGNDQFWGGAGADSLDGGNGYDIARYDFAASGVVARLDGGANAGEAAGDTYANIEALYGSAFGDILIGDAGGNVLAGLGGADLLYGLAGNDILLGGGGADAFAFNTAGFGTDTVLDFATTAAAGANHDYVDFRGIPALSSFVITQVGANAHIVTNHGTSSCRASQPRRWSQATSCSEAVPQLT